jgi:hypothetical protein
LPDTVLAVAVFEPVEVPEEDFDELPPQAVASMHAAASDKSQVERFIDILLLRSRSTIASGLAAPESRAARAAASPRGQHLGNI